MDGGKPALQNFCCFRVSVPESEISALANFDPNSITCVNCSSYTNFNTYGNSNAYVATPIPDLSPSPSPTP